MKRGGFSLVELSIVLVILGLLVGGVLSGQALIRAAQLRGIMTEQQRYFAAARTFRDRYFAIPGDLINATSFWGAADGGNGKTSGCRTALESTSATGTCNGDGDGTIGGAWGGNIQEQWLVWNQLALAGLIEGKYFSAPDQVNPVLGVSVPKSKAGGGWSVCYTSYGNYGRGSDNMLVYGMPGWATGVCSMGTTTGLLPTEAWNIDKKMDDGSAGTGNVTAEDSYPAWGSCASAGFGWSTLPSNYQLANSQPTCRMYWHM